MKKRHDLKIPDFLIVFHYYCLFAMLVIFVCSIALVNTTVRIKIKIIVIIIIITIIIRSGTVIFAQKEIIFTLKTCCVKKCILTPT